jgi:hypothetical protein
MMRTMSPNFKFPVNPKFPVKICKRETYEGHEGHEKKGRWEDGKMGSPMMAEEGLNKKFLRGVQKRENRKIGKKGKIGR